MTLNSLQFQAFKAIRKKIIYCDLEPGKKISEKNLEEMLKIGRTPIRESLIQLRQQELVYTIPQSGTYVSKIDLKAAENARFTREHLERQIMIECCAKLDKQTSIILQTVLEEQEKAAAAKNERDFFAADNLFHEICFEIADRREIWTWLDDHNTHLERFRWLRVLTNGLPWETILEQHYNIFHALIAKNPEEVNFLTAFHSHMMLYEKETVVGRFPEYFTTTEK
ncbi:GntR family transcriptional regulator [Enterococcus villorum]|uniref:GntR family transcriptional regulator n=1 Tax=Enterococcus villorum TaxID=112904 RepID=A0A1V8Y9L9_9ENTE|nr:GntR family transcriptional regulator [Enterococcus villorum]OQO69275.1 GntR family transcriptional regulator [Enterococcus villorum]OQO73750.1 GntR family transcriptional regulator [Enterococcus villorum]